MSVETVDDLFARFGRAYVPMVMATGMVASFVMVVSSTIVNVAVPDVMGAFGIGQDQAQLMATAFNVSMTASQLLNAWVVAVLGQRYGFAAALIIYTCGSFIGGFSQDFNMIVLGRVLQGIASGIIQPLILVTIFQVFPQEHRGFAAGVYSMALMLAVAMGPVFGGLAMEVLDWR
ncbi:MAG: MFS transporter, partial [Pseudomonadota bacterium]|nr:MFS transporter [Pseudomonadota bacterium]